MSLPILQLGIAVAKGGKMAYLGTPFVIQRLAKELLADLLCDKACHFEKICRVVKAFGNKRGTEGGTTAFKDPNYQRFCYVRSGVKLDLALGGLVVGVRVDWQAPDVVSFRRRYCFPKK
jgi:hypothetical protein